MSETTEFNPSCVCGGTQEQPNADCERCRMLAQLAAEKQRADAIQECYDRDTAKLNQEASRLYAANAGIYWRWIGDGTDYLESLSCPILIDVGQLRDIVNAGLNAQNRLDAAEARAAGLQQERAFFMQEIYEFGCKAMSDKAIDMRQRSLGFVWQRVCVLKDAIKHGCRGGILLAPAAEEGGGDGK